MKARPTGKAGGVKAWLGMWMALLLPMMAQQMFEVPIPDKPDDHVLDQARLFVVEPERRELMAAKVKEFSARSGYEVHVAFFDNLIGVDLREQADLLQDAWVGDGPGLVFVAVTDSGDWRLAWADTPDVMTEGGGPMPVLDRKDIAPQDKVGVVHALSNLPKMSPGSIEGAERLVDTLLANLEVSFIEQEPKRDQRLRFWVLGIGLLAGLILIAVITVTLLRRLDAKARDILVLPDAPVGQRLGAPCGGGKVSVMTFQQSPGDES